MSTCNLLNPLHPFPKTKEWLNVAKGYQVQNEMKANHMSGRNKCITYDKVGERIMLFTWGLHRISRNRNKTTQRDKEFLLGDQKYVDRNEKLGIHAGVFKMQKAESIRVQLKCGGRVARRRVSFVSVFRKDKDCHN